MAETTMKSTRSPYALLGVFGVAGVVLWTYWPGFIEMADKWDRRPEYSHGWMVPLFALYLLMNRQDTPGADEAGSDRRAIGLFVVGVLGWLTPWMFGWTGTLSSITQWVGIALTLAGFSWLVADCLSDIEIKPNWWGLPVLVLAIALRLISAQLYLEWLDFVSLIPFTLGIVLLAGGWKVLRWSWVAILFVFFMIPLPFSLEVALRDPLRRAGTLASTFAMQTLGLPAFSEGNVVTVNNVGIDVVEACSGLRMMMVFFALSIGVAILLERPLWQRLLIAFSAIPIALIANIARITTTGLLYVWGYNEFADDFFHDIAGWLMPLMAVGMLFLELWYLDHLFIIDEKKPMRFGIDDGRGPVAN